MRKIFENPYFIVFDEFLDSSEFEELWNFFQLESFEFIQSKKWIKVNRLTDGNSLYSAARFSKRVENVSLENIHPFQNSMDIFFEKLRLVAPKIKSVIGIEGRDWKVFSARSYIYPPNSGLSWHNDHYGYSGAYVYYVHPYWNCKWGGELLIGDRTVFNIKYNKQKEKGRFLGFHLENELENEQLMKFGIGNYILPKPNRIVFLKSGIHHMIKKVDEAAGDKPRCSIAGFFVKDL